jgi:hypothetical protein
MMAIRRPNLELSLGGLNVCNLAYTRCIGSNSLQTWLSPSLFSINSYESSCRRVVFPTCKRVRTVFWRVGLASRIWSPAFTSGDEKACRP